MKKKISENKAAANNNNVNNENKYVPFEYRGIVFLTGNPRVTKSFEKLLAKTIEILDRMDAAGGEINIIDRFTLLNMLYVSFHDEEGSKIQGITSIDSSCHGCAFCHSMRLHAESNILHICGGCYDFAQENYKIAARNRHSLNMLILMTVSFTVEELKTLSLTEKVRINSSGDVPNVTYAENSLKLGYAFPWCKIGFWSKNVPAIQKAVENVGKPENVILVQSSLLIGIPAKLAKYFDYTFTVYPDKETTEEAIKAGSMACNGTKCMHCGFKCYFGTWPNGCNIAECLRNVKKEKVNAIKAALDEYMNRRAAAAAMAKKTA